MFCCAAGVEVTCLGLCPDSSCLLIDVSDGLRILVDCPIEPVGMKTFPVSAVMRQHLASLLLHTFPFRD
jgi:hypothetical protein